MKKISVLVFCSLALWSCRVAQSVVARDNIKQDTVKMIQRDSVFVQKLDTVKITQKGDTIFNEIVRWRISYKEKLKSDTIIKIDYRTETKTETVEVPKMNGFQRGCFWGFWILILVLILYILVRIFLKKFFFK